LQEGDIKIKFNFKSKRNKELSNWSKLENSHTDAAK
jgi:hypothetical protein